MTRHKFFERWRAWAAGLKYMVLQTRRLRIRCEFVLEVQPFHEDDDLAVDTVLPGWQSRPGSDGWVRLVPPTR